MTTHRFNVAEYYRLGELGLLDQRTELIDGIITDMEPIGPWHASIGDLLSQLFTEQAGGRYLVRVQYPIDLGPDSQPQPDLVLYRPGRYRDRHPRPADIFLIVEIADTTLHFDLTEKRALYASAGIPEYWVIDVQGKKLIRFLLAGTELVQRPVSGTRISPEAFTDVSVDLAELFG
jgi:Uma2 family endonuclease